MCEAVDETYERSLYAEACSLRADVNHVLPIVGMPLAFIIHADISTKELILETQSHMQMIIAKKHSVLAHVTALNDMLVTFTTAVSCRFLTFYV